MSARSDRGQKVGEVNCEFCGLAYEEALDNCANCGMAPPTQEVNEHIVDSGRAFEHKDPLSATGRNLTTPNEERNKVFGPLIILRVIFALLFSALFAGVGVSIALPLVAIVGAIASSLVSGKSPDEFYGTLNFLHGDMKVIFMGFWVICTIILTILEVKKDYLSDLVENM